MPVRVSKIAAVAVALGALLPSHSARAQHASSCFIASQSTQALTDPAGISYVVAPDAVLSDGRSTIVIGAPTIGISRLDWEKQKITTDPLLVGLRISTSGMVTPISAPHDLDSARYFRAVARGDGTDIVYFVRDLPSAQTIGPESGTLWHARLTGARVQSPNRIAHVTSARVPRNQSSRLDLRDGVLRFAIGYEEGSERGGVMIWRSDDGDHWSVDSLPLRYAPIWTGFDEQPSPTRELHVYAVAMIFEDHRIYPGSLLVGDAIHPSAMTPLIRSNHGSLDDATIMTNGNITDVAWWHGVDTKGDRPTVWAQRLTDHLEHDDTDRQPVAENIYGFGGLVAQPAQLQGGSAMLLAYRSLPAADSIHVVALVNGKPQSVGTIPFVDGFLMNGARSGTAAMTLATAAIPRRGAPEPPASRTLSFTVDCGESRGTQP